MKSTYRKDLDGRDVRVESHVCIDATGSNGTFVVIVEAARPARLNHKKVIGLAKQCLESHLRRGG